MILKMICRSIMSITTTTTVTTLKGDSDTGNWSNLVQITKK